MKTTSTSRIATIGVCGASVVGPAHRRLGKPCEDAWSLRQFRGFATLAVSDGLGSRDGARAGARAACLTAHQVGKLWLQVPNAKPDDFVRLLEPLWRLRLGDVDPSAYAATVLFAGIRPDGSGAAFQLGDGLLCWEEADGTFRRLSGSPKSFGNETPALGPGNNGPLWSHAPISDWASILLATDGVADDLREEGLPSFLKTMATEVSNQDRNSAQRWLRSELRNWATPNHLDDKTIAILTGGQ